MVYKALSCQLGYSLYCTSKASKLSAVPFISGNERGKETALAALAGKGTDAGAEGSNGTDAGATHSAFCVSYVVKASSKASSKASTSRGRSYTQAPSASVFARLYHSKASKNEHLDIRGCPYAPAGPVAQRQYLHFCTSKASKQRVPPRRLSIAAYRALCS
jgi:hypothetical protein